MKRNLGFKELLVAYSAQVDALAQLMIEKGLITEAEFYEKLKKVQRDYFKSEGIVNVTKNVKN